MPERFGGAFGVFDFFAYIVPGTLALVPLLSLTTPPDIPGGELVLALHFFVSAYVLGIVLNFLGGRLERIIGKPPSRRVLVERKPPLSDGLAKLAREHIEKDYRLPAESSERTLWDAAYGWVSNVGPHARVHQFLLLSSMSRSLEIVGALGAIASGVWIVNHARWLALLVVAALILFVWIFDRLRDSYSYRMAQEVYIAYVNGRHGSTGSH